MDKFRARQLSWNSSQELVTIQQQRLHRSPSVNLWQLWMAISNEFIPAFLLCRKCLVLLVLKKPLKTTHLPSCPLNALATSTKHRWISVRSCASLVNPSARLAQSRIIAWRFNRVYKTNCLFGSKKQQYLIMKSV